MVGDVHRMMWKSAGWGAWRRKLGPLKPPANGYKELVIVDMREIVHPIQKRAHETLETHLWMSSCNCWCIQIVLHQNNQDYDLFG